MCRYCFKYLIGIAGLVVCVAASAAMQYEEQTIELRTGRQTLRVPQGFKVELLTDKLDGPRLLTFAKNGDLFLGTRSGKIYRLPPPYTEPEVLVKLGDYPHSVALRNDEILIARTSGLYHAPYKLGEKSIPPKSVTLLARLPGGGGHSSRTVAIGPDQRVYLSLGIQGNCSDQFLEKRYSVDDRRGGILVLNETDKPTWEAFGSGLRNPIGFDWQPQTGVLYASNNGPDHQGFDQPPEYFSRVTRGSFHGMPWFQYDGKRLQRDPCVSSAPPRPMSEVSTPVATFPARDAPMAVSFVPKGAMLKNLEGDAVVALHGSWATRPDGDSLGAPSTRRPPKLVVVHFSQGVAQDVEDLISGFQDKKGGRWARPVGVAFGPDGALYFSSDNETNGLFRLSKK